MLSGDTIQSRLIIAVASVALSVAAVFLLATVVLSLVPTTPESEGEKEPENVISAEEELAIESAVSEAILEHNKSGYLPGQFQAEGHDILEIVKDGNQFKVYCIASYGEYSLENDAPNRVSGSGAIPTVITFQKTESDTFKLLKYEEPLDGEKWLESLKSMFPAHLLPKVEKANDYLDALLAQEEDQARTFFASQ